MWTFLLDMTRFSVHLLRSGGTILQLGRKPQRQAKAREFFSRDEQERLAVNLLLAQHGTLSLVERRPEMRFGPYHEFLAREAAARAGR